MRVEFKPAADDGPLNLADKSGRNLTFDCTRLDCDKEATVQLFYRSDIHCLDLVYHRQKEESFQYPCQGIRRAGILSVSAACQGAGGLLPVFPCRRRTVAKGHLSAIQGGDILVFDPGNFWFRFLRSAIRTGAQPLFRIQVEEVGDFHNFVADDPDAAVASVSPGKDSLRKQMASYPGQSFKAVAMRLIHLRMAITIQYSSRSRKM